MPKDIVIDPSARIPLDVWEKLPCQAQQLIRTQGPQFMPQKATMECAYKPIRPGKPKKPKK